MAKQTINIGSSPNKGDGDPLRLAFEKINSNFNEVYTSISDTSILLETYNSDTANSIESITTTINNLEIPTAVSELTNDTGFITLSELPTDISELTDTQNLLGQGVSDIDLSNVNQDIIPDSDAIRTLGSPTRQWKELYVSNGSIYIGNVKLSNTNGVLQVNTVETQIDPDTQEEIEVVLESESVKLTRLPYIELTNNPFIVKPVLFEDPIIFIRTDSGSETDSIDVNLTLARGSQGALYNIDLEVEYDRNNHTSPAGTEWNAEGWGDLLNLQSRSYSTLRSVLNNSIGNNIIGVELVMHDTINDKYYKFLFSDWGNNNGGSFAYTRTLINNPNYFKKDDYATANNVDVIEDDSTLQIGITRNSNQGIYNPFVEEGWNSSVSPSGTLWNTDGWSDLSDVTSRTYLPLYEAFGSGGLGNKIVGSKTIMYAPDIEKYYAIEWLSWSQNANGGGFSYLRYELDLNKLNEGIKFPDGTTLKSAEGVGRIKSSATGNRRIEEVYGYNSVAVIAVTSGVTQNAVIRQTSNNWDFYVNATPELTQLYDAQNTFNYFEFSFDGGNNWIKVRFGGGQYDVYYQMVFDDNINRPVDADTVVAYRIITGAQPVVWWNKNDLPGGGADFRGAVIDYHAYSGEATWIGTIHIVDDAGEEHITHTEVASGSTDSENDDLWLVQNEGTISYRRIDGEAKTLKIHWTAKVFYGSEFWD